MVTSERGREGIGGGVAGALRDLSQGEIAEAEMVSRESHAPLREVLHWRLLECLLERACERWFDWPSSRLSPSGMA